MNVLSLYRSCKGWGKLPVNGGMLEQEWRTMELLDFVDAEVSKWRNKKVEDEKNEMMKQDMIRRATPRG